MEMLHIRDERELKTVVEKTLVLLEEIKQENRASVLALHGDLGAGKTTFMQYLARELGITEVVNSPTYVIMKKYEVEDTGAEKASPFLHLYHIDAYRIEDTDEMRPLRFSEVLQERDTLVCIEWAERIKALLPAHTVHMQIDIESDDSRTITFS